MDELIKLGDAIVSTGDKTAQTQFQEKMGIVWLPLRTILEIVIAFSPPKVDNVLDKIIEIGNWLSNSDHDASAPLTV